LMIKHGLNISAENLFIFIKESIVGREYAKFIFTKTVNEILKLIKNYGRQIRLSPDDMAFIEIGSLMKLYSTVAMFDQEKQLKNEILQNRERYEFYQHIKLPYLICEPEDIYCFHSNDLEPNYITDKKNAGTTMIIKPNIDKKEIRGKIVFIENADPGFDWIFSQNIKGLITAYGGANSHMAIRAAELQIPAIIGCGPTLFENWSRAQKIEIDCLNKKITVFS
jgi:glutamine kinase